MQIIRRQCVANCIRVFPTIFVSEKVQAKIQLTLKIKIYLKDGPIFITLAYPDTLWSGGMYRHLSVVRQQESVEHIEKQKRFAKMRLNK